MLSALGAVYRHDPRRIQPGAWHLLGSGHKLLSTDLGDLDCLGEIDGGKTYEHLVGSVIDLEIAPELRCKVLGLRTLIEIKRRAGRPKDLAAIPVLESTAEEVEKLELAVYGSAAEIRAARGGPR